MKAIVLKSDEFYHNKQERKLEEQSLWFIEQYRKLQKSAMDESSKHYVTQVKLEKAEMAKLDAEYALKREKQAHERTKKEMYLEIASLKRELEKYKTAGMNRKNYTVLKQCK